MLGKTPFVNGTVVGHYRVSVASGLTTGMGANATSFSCRFNSTAGIRAVLLNLKIRSTIVTPFTAAQEIGYAAYVARAWSVADSTGTPVVLTSPNNVMNSLGDVASIADMRISATGGVTAGTRTLDANPFLQFSTTQLLAAAAAAQADFGVEWKPSADWEPLIALNALTPNQEGIVVRSVIAQGAAGTVRLVVDMEWLEFQGLANVGTLA